MANIFPIDFEEKLTMAQDDYILFSDSEDGNKIKKAQYSNLKGEKGDTGARINSASFSGDDIVFGETDGSSVTLANAKTTLQGPQGEEGPTGPTGNGIASITSSKVGKTTTVTITETNTNVDTFQIEDGADGQGDVTGPASSTDSHVVLFDGTTGKLIKDSGKTLSDYVTVETDQDVNSNKTIKGVLKVQNGQGTGSFWVGGDVNANTLRNNQRHLARISVPSYSDITLGATLLGFDTSGDSDMHVTNKTYDVVSFGGMKKITNATSPMAIGFCVASERNGTSSGKKVYPLELDANEARFNVQPNYNGTNLATTSDIPSVVDNLTSTSTTNALSANQGKVLNDKISDLMGLGKFLSLWDATTGQPISFPLSTPYTYTTGDYFLVEVVSTATPPVNYKPNGSSYTGSASSTTESGELEVGDIYIYDGTTWLLQLNHGKTVSFSEIAGSPSDNTNLGNALSAKQDSLTLPATPTSGHLVTWGANNKTLADGGAIPTVPTNVSDFNNDAGYLTSSTGVTSVNSNVGAVTVNEVPSGGNNGDVLTNVSGTPTWSAPSGGDVMVSTQANNILTTGMKIWAGTKANYEALGTYDNNTVYLTI